jgi:hypothetical protein
LEKWAEVLEVVEVLLYLDPLPLQCLHQMVHVDYCSSEYLTALEKWKTVVYFLDKDPLCYFSIRSFKQIVKGGMMSMASQFSTLKLDFIGKFPFPLANIMDWFAATVITACFQWKTCKCTHRRVGFDPITLFTLYATSFSCSLTFSCSPITSIA